MLKRKRLVWRIEHKLSRLGPFIHNDEDYIRKSFSGYDVKALHDMLSVYEDVWGFSSDHVCGFYASQWAKVKRKMSKRDRAKLANQGFKLVCFRISPQHVLVGSQQVAFERDYAEKVKELDLI